MENEVLALAGSAGKVHSELEQVQQQMADTPLFAPEVEAVMEVMYHRLLKKKDEEQQTSFVATSGQTGEKRPVSPARDRVPPSPSSPSWAPVSVPRSPTASHRSSIPRSRSGKSPGGSPQQSREKGWDPYFARQSEPRTPQQDLQNKVIDYYDKHNQEIERAERRLEAELRGIDGQLKRRKNKPMSPSPQRTYHRQQEQRPKSPNYRSLSPRSERPRIVASPGYAVSPARRASDSLPPPSIPSIPSTPPQQHVSQQQSVQPQHQNPQAPNQQVQQHSQQHQSAVAQQPEQQPVMVQNVQPSPSLQQLHPLQSVQLQQQFQQSPQVQNTPQRSPQQPSYQASPYDTQVTRKDIQKQISTSLHAPPVIPQLDHSPQIPKSQFNASTDIEEKLRHIREQLGNSPGGVEYPRAQSVPAFSTSAPPVVRLQTTPQARKVRVPSQPATPQPQPQLRQAQQPQSQPRPESPTIEGPYVDNVLDMLQRSKAARKEPIHYDPHHQPPAMPLPPRPSQSPSPMRRARSPKKTPAGKSVVLQEPKKSSPPQLKMEEVIARLQGTPVPHPEASVMSAATSDSSVQGPIANFVQDTPPPVPSLPVVSREGISCSPTRSPVGVVDAAMPSHNPTVRPLALPKSSYNARRKWEHVTYSDDATRRLMALKDEAKEYADETQHKLEDYTTSLAKQVTETVPAQMDKTEDAAEYPPPPQHYHNVDRTEVQDSSGALGILEDINKQFTRHRETGEALLTNVKNIDALVEQKELEERTKPETREENSKEGCLRTLRRGKDGEKELTWKDVWVEADNRELRFYPVHESKHGRGREKPLGRVRYSETARLAEDLGNDGVYFYFGLERHTDAKVSIFTLCTSSLGSRRSWCSFLNSQMRIADSIRLGRLPTTWSHEQPFDELEP
eukprot:TRINITY_DN21643_c0_g1_i1.p1 TRINITY_DN21643_c0_g1~~TRINITY_DN21643_c0_g1_i1.p1  ORF type:complete len:901 (+),score=152.76 TRINITY_DN21643_c0_g1_i1:43-2745(+)